MVNKSPDAKSKNNITSLKHEVLIGVTRLIRISVRLTLDFNALEATYLDNLICLKIAYTNFRKSSNLGQVG